MLTQDYNFQNITQEMCYHRHLYIFLQCFLAVWILKNSFVTALDHYEYAKGKKPTFQEPKPIQEEKINASKWTKRNRTKRDIWQLYGVITCMTPCDPFVLKDYGCYCGLGGTGNPVDAIDRCCMLHDYCYHNTPCHQALTYFLPYNWKCVGRRPHCSLPARWSPAYTCAIQLCECDRMFSECLNSHGCPKNKAICNSSQVRHMWQKFLIKLGIG